MIHDTVLNSTKNGDSVNEAISSDRDAVVRLHSVTKRFGSQTALDRVSLTVPRGSVFALLGENGAGKTTAIKILLGLLDPDSGHTSVDRLDSRVDGLKIRRRVGYVPEHPSLYDWMSVEEIGWFAAGFYASGYLSRYLEQINEFGVNTHKRIKQLSKGMRAKVALALALAHDPELLILDEPTSGLDAMVRRSFLERMVDRAATGKTVLLSSHQIAEVERVADYVAIIRQGRLVTVESVDELKASCSELTMTLAEGLSLDTLPLPGDLIQAEQEGRHCRAMLRGVTSHDIARLRANAPLEAIEMHSPKLEDIFVAYMTGSRKAEDSGMARAKENQR